MKKTLLAALIAFPVFGFSQGSMGEAVGTVVTQKEREPILNAKVYTESNGTKYGAMTDIDGRFRISAIPPGKYAFSIVFEGDTVTDLLATVPMEGIVNMGTIAFNAQMLDDVVVGPPIMPNLTYGVASEIKMDLEQIKKSPQKFDQKAMIASMSSDIRLTDDGELVFRGARKGDMIYMMDGVKMTQISNVPSASIGGMMAYTGGIPAKYGDTTGGVVVMESLSYFDLYRAWKASHPDE
ncbi:MAG: carboxypeptidase regulatory-like domain-containing protein [Bacteroidota bacterium]